MNEFTSLSHQLLRTYAHLRALSTYGKLVNHDLDESVSFLSRELSARSPPLSNNSNIENDQQVTKQTLLPETVSVVSKTNLAEIRQQRSSLSQGKVRKPSPLISGVTQITR